jgi:hypothetical protein
MGQTKQLYQEVYATDLWLNDYIQYKKQIDEQHERDLETSL